MKNYLRIVLALVTILVIGTGTVSLAAKDRVKPVINKIVVNPSPANTIQNIVVSFNLSEKAKVTLEIYKGSKLIRTGLAQTLKNKGVVTWVWKGDKTEGNYSLKITAVDLAGNKASNQVVTVKVQKPSPPSNDDLNKKGTYQRNFTLTKAGVTYGPVQGITIVKGNVILKGNNITLRNIKINGTLTIDPGANGNAVIDNISAPKIEVLSGAPHSIKAIRVKAEVLLVKYDNDVRIVTSAGTVINETNVESGASLVTMDNSTFGDVAINAANQTVSLEGTFSEVSVFGTGSTVLATAGSNISEVLVRTSVELVGDFSETVISVTENNANLTIGDNSEIKDLVINATANLTVDSTAKVQAVNVRANVNIDGTISGIVTLAVNNVTCTISDGAIVNTIQKAEGVTNAIVINEQPVTTSPTTSTSSETPVLSSAKVITSTTVGTLTAGNVTAVPVVTKVSDLKAGLTVSTGATVEILTGPGGAIVGNQSTTDVTASMVIRVTAENGSTAEYTIAMAPVLSSAKVITATTVGTVTNGNVTAVPVGTKVIGLIDALIVSQGATVEILDQIGGLSANDQDDVNGSMVIIVYAEDGSTAEYTIAMAPVLSNAKAIMSTNIGTLVSGNIINVPLGTQVSTLKGRLIVSPGASIEILDGTGEGPVANQEATDVTNTMVIKVTAEDGSEAEYSISLVPEVINDKEITSTTVGRLRNGNVTWVPRGTTVSELMAGLTVSPNAIFVILDENGLEVLDPDNTEVNSSMIVEVTAEDLTINQYSISVVSEISVTSSAIIDGNISVEYTQDGDNTSIPVTWNPIDGAASYALIMYDSDAGDFTHWFVEEIPSNINELRAGASQDGIAGLEVNNDYDNLGYDGPLLADNYVIVIYSLLTPTIETPDTYASRAEFEDAISNIVIGKGEISGTYNP